MKIKSIIAALLLCCSLQPLKAQTNHVYGEFLGVGLLGGFSYERMVMDKLAARVSYGGFTAESSTMSYDYASGWTTVTTEISVNPVTVGAHYFFGNKFKAEVGAGISYWMVSFTGGVSGDVGGLSITEDGGLLNFYTSVGLRYQNPDGGLTFKLGLSPTIVADVGSLAFPHIGIGYSW
tara:strand:- start:218 stop:751 length:534 start_codon:yes stop_codon:yes gene_type:complete